MGGLLNRGLVINRVQLGRGSGQGRAMRPIFASWPMEPNGTSGRHIRRGTHEAKASMKLRERSINLVSDSFN